MKHVQAYLSASEERESSFHHSGGTVGLVQACSYAGKTCQSRFNLRGGVVKHMQACLSAREDRESSFRRYGSPVEPVQACSFAGKT